VVHHLLIANLPFKSPNKHGVILRLEPGIIVVRVGVGKDRSVSKAQVFRQQDVVALDNSGFGFGFGHGHLPC